MCLNCGCMIPDDDMGDHHNITTHSLAEGAVASHMDGKTTLENMKKTLELVSPEDIDKEIAKIKGQG
ncbi:MAG: hypothetical protein US28_C0021G0009 [Candidatus Daviesbacteria bacterium GW2011_GWA1_36_8]|uniref:Uncharacterized protein n=2 Tax=Candidatus Daviesiibacteriota TaxID=1752718 RepID=A0A0G0F7J8_9BACT|nr:MAG: hypothetical protein US28_C0021G0009 [Candidatus Daviesbacteria bacterium GW2011_GWA1_36_8]